MENDIKELESTFCAYAAEVVHLPCSYVLHHSSLSFFFIILLYHSSLSGSALGLLLVFRTNTAYNRFWEGRRIWERILNSLRDLGRMTVLYGDVIKSARVEKILHLLCAYPLGGEL